MQKKKPISNIKLELNIDELNIIMESLAKQPFKEVYKLIEKIHLQAKANSMTAQQKK